MLKVKRALSLILALVMCCVLFSMAVSAEGAVRELYVSAAGSDEAAGTQDAPLASLAKAADIVNKDENGTAFVIHVVDDLTATACARFYNHDVTIVGDGETAPVVTRGEDFKTQSDLARSWYNPAMVEVQTSSDVSVSLTLKNIVFDDGGRHEGSIFAQAVSGEGHGDNTQCVQDAIIASNATQPCTITLDEGVVLRNFGGESAIRTTNEAVIVMKSGSVIEDDSTITTRGDSADVENAAKGPAGAVWLQGGRFVMEQGAEIRNLNGRAVYVDGGEAEIGGTISGITGNKQMWFGNDGTAIHLRNTNASATLTSTASIKNISGGGHMIRCSDGAKSFVMKHGARIFDCPELKGNVILAQGCEISIDGEICNINASGNHVLQTAGNTVTTVGINGNIHNNTTHYGTLYLNGTTEKLYFYGKVNHNTVTGRGAGIVLSNNGKDRYAEMYSGAEIVGNEVVQNGGGIMVSCGTFTMEGGIISQNTAHEEGGGVSVRRGGQFIMRGGKICENTSDKFGGGISLEASEYNGCVPYVQLNGGEVSENTLKNGKSNDLAISSTQFGHINRYLYISDDVSIGDTAVYFQTEAKTVAPAAESMDIKLENASTESNHALTRAANEKGWNTPFATFWVQRDSAAVMTVGGLTLEESLPQIVYALVQETGEDGKPLSGAEVKAYNTQITAEGICVTLPNGTENGYAVALVQPKADLGRVVITTTKPELNEDKNLTGNVYEVPYTATYTMSDNLLNQLKLAPRGVPMTFVVELDSRLTAKTDADGRFLYTFDGDGVLNVDESQITVSADGHTITVVCTPVDDWVNALRDKTSVVMTLNGTSLLAADDFKAGDYLNTTGHIEGTVPAGAGAMTVMIPANVCRTKMIGKSGEEPIVDPTVPFIPAFLLGEEHEAYVSGYPDGTVRPESNITRAEVAAMLYRLLPGRTASSGLYSFRDVTTDKWYYSAVSVMTDGGYINGYSDGTFRGENAITRAEFVAMLTRFMGARACGSCGFTDVSAAHWAYDSIAAASANGWITGYPDGRFRPERPITRAEAMAIINRALNRGVDETSWLGSYVDWPDNHRSAWYYYEVIEATNNHYYTGSRPSEDWTEAGR